MKISLLVLMEAFFLLPFATHAQKHDNFWLWGYNNTSTNPNVGGVTMNFYNSSPNIYPEKKKVNFGFYCGICSDSSGRLTFYSNGISIRDTTHNIMLNGDTINPGLFWEQYKNSSYPNGPFCFALPSPEKNNQYFFFHMAADITNTAITSPFYYSIIDMDGNNGKGHVTQKNHILLPHNNDYIDPVAVKHGNGRDWWVITGEVQKPILYTFLLDPDGVHGPFTTIMPYQFSGTDYQSVNDISPDGSKYVRAAGRLGLYIYDFDRCNGSFNNLKAIPFADQNFLCFATVFAPDSKHLYLSSFQTVMGIDVSAPDIIASLDTLAYFDGKASPQPPLVTGFFNPNLGPDGKIYYATTNGTLSMHVIHNPDLPGQAADVEQHGLALPKYNSGTMCQFPNYRLGEWEGSPCDTINGQKPGDGFVKSDWYPPAVSNPKGYTLLPPLFKGGESSGKAPERMPNMAEMAIMQMEAERKQAEKKEAEQKH